MNRQILVTLSAAALASSSHAAFLGWTAIARTARGATVVDIFAVTSSANHKLLNVYDASIGTSDSGGFFQAAGLASKTWKPDSSGYTSTRDTIDSFMTIGAERFDGDPNIYAGSTTAGDPNFVSPYWNGTPASLAASTVPSLAGWYSTDPTSSTLLAETLSGVSGERQGTAGLYGVWAGHLVIASTAANTITWNVSATVKNLETNLSQQLTFTNTFTIPAPGAFALLGIARAAARRSRRH